MSTLSLVRAKELKRPLETDLAYEDRIAAHAMHVLSTKEQLSDQEKEELKCLERNMMTKVQLIIGGMALYHSDEDRVDIMERVHREFRAEFGYDTMSKKLLIERLVSAYSMALSYERLLLNLKYAYNEKEGFQYKGFMANVMKEIRLGIKTANDEILRLDQALRDINRPPLIVKTNNAFFAQNQQVNQGVPPRDLENDTFATGQYATHSRRMSTAPAA